MKKILVFFLATALVSCDNAADKTSSADTAQDGTEIINDTMSKDRLVGDSIAPLPDSGDREPNPYIGDTSKPQKKNSHR